MLPCEHRGRKGGVTDIAHHGLLLSFLHHFIRLWEHCKGMVECGLSSQVVLLLRAEVKLRNLEYQNLRFEEIIYIYIFKFINDYEKSKT